MCGFVWYEMWCGCLDDLDFGCLNLWFGCLDLHFGTASSIYAAQANQK